MKSTRPAGAASDDDGGHAGPLRLRVRPVASATGRTAGGPPNVLGCPGIGGNTGGIQAVLSAHTGRVRAECELLESGVEGGLTRRGADAPRGSRVLYPGRSTAAGSLLLFACSSSGDWNQAPVGGSSSGGDAANGGSGSGGNSGSVTGSSSGGGIGSSSGGTSSSSGGTSSAGDSGTRATTCASLLVGGASSKWVSVDANGNLVYATMARGDCVSDFSRAGYGGGGIALPDVPVQKTVTPSGGDDTAAIQGAIDAVSAMPATAGIRGAVLLGPGTFTLSSSALGVHASGVVLRGSGSGTGGTVVQLSGAPRHFVDITGTGSFGKIGTPAHITDAYVPSGSSSFHVSTTAGLTPGTAVLVGRPVTQAWIHFMGMDTLVRNGVAQTWMTTGTVIQEDRVITAVAGDQVSVDMPITDSFDAQYVQPGVTVEPYTFAGRIENVGLESMRIVAPTSTAAINTTTFMMLGMDAVINAWVRDVAGQDFINGMQIGGKAKWVTVEDTSLAHSVAANGSSGYPADFTTDGQGILFLRCTSQGDHVFAFVSQNAAPGPNVVLDMKATGNPTNLAPHQRWATGLLLDRITAPTGGIELQNRATAGSGQGWAIGFGLAWNSSLQHMLIEAPPGSMNWAIGTSGTIDRGTPVGTYDSMAMPVRPHSLYLAQLCARLGPSALGNIGY